MLFEQNSKLVMIGDSITDCGRQRPVGEGAGLGDGYVRMIDAVMGAFHPASNLRILNVGSSGHTVRDLANRWQTDVIDLEPDYLSIMIGTNDVWRQFDSPLNPNAAVMPEEYGETLRSLVELTRSQVRKIILMTPFFIEPLTADRMRSRMDEYGAIVKGIAKSTDCAFVDTQAAFDIVLKSKYSAVYGWDRVHPTSAGHMVLAKSFLSETEVSLV